MLMAEIILIKSLSMSRIICEFYFDVSNLRHGYCTIIPAICMNENGTSETIIMSDFFSKILKSYKTI